MNARALSDHIYCIHADIQAGELFEGIWPVPQGVSLNSYLVKGEKTALVDPVMESNEGADQVETALSSFGVKFQDINCLILNHLEPDHSGRLKEFRKLCPTAEIISTAKGIELIKSFYKIDTGLRAVKDGDALDLGGGKILTFFETPNIHWPETMMTVEAESGILFSCDAFGSFGALGEKVFDDEFSPDEHAFFEKEAQRYYSNIVSSFSNFVEKAVQKLSGLKINCVAPGHGMVWRKEPKKIIDRYSRYASYSKGPAEKEIAVIWGSMYGNTKAGIDAVIRGIEDEGVPYSIFRVPEDNVSYILSAAYRASGLVLAMPSYEYAMFPPMAYVLDVFRRKHIFGKKALRIGSFGWVGGAKKEYEAVLEKLRWESLEPVEWAGYPGEAEFKLLAERGRELAKAVRDA